MGCRTTCSVSERTDSCRCPGQKSERTIRCLCACSGGRTMCEPGGPRFLPSLARSLTPGRDTRSTSPSENPSGASSPGLSWGPVGSVGFELATAFPAANCSSDLDLIIRLSDVLVPRIAEKVVEAIEDAG